MMSSRDVLVFRVGLFTRVALLTFLPTQRSDSLPIPQSESFRINSPDSLAIDIFFLMVYVFCLCFFSLVLHTLWSRSGGVLRFLVLACPETYT